MKNSIFDYRDYKEYLRDVFSQKPGKGRGMRSALAQAIGCQTTYVSQVLNSKPHFSMEQAEQINRYLRHSREESHYFMLLIQFDRAGTPALREYVQRQIEEIHQKRLVLKHRVDVKKTLSIQDQAIYYSAWYYAAVHVAVTIPELSTKETIADYLGLSVARVSEALEFLCSLGLVIEEKGHFKSGVARIYLGSDSPNISKHHSNWRLQAVRALERSVTTDLHYSSVVTVSEEDVMKIKSELVKTIEKIKAVIKDSPAQGIHCFSMDFFRMKV